MAFPKGFEDLEKFAPEWVVADVVARQRKRAESDLAAIKQVYDDVYPHLDRIMAHLNAVPMDAMSDTDKSLYWLVATWNEISHPVDLNWSEPDEFWSFPFERVQLWERVPTD
jgi:uncharacterized protein YqiB (DUF1249 family)